MIISLLIPTKNRPEKLYRCILSIFQNSDTDFEILIADQSDNYESKKVIRKFSSSTIKYYKQTSTGKTKSLNNIIPLARGEILAFCDDDNVVDRFYIRNIKKFFTKNQDTHGVFGSVLPYKPSLHPNLICPSIFYLKNERVVTSPTVIHYEVLGVGGNMILRKSVFNKVGYFREWLGPGFLGMQGGEDSEFIYRMLTNGLGLKYSPTIVVYHDRWMTPIKEQLLATRYTLGLSCFYFYYLLSGDKEVFPLLKTKIRERLIEKISTIKRRRLNSLQSLSRFLFEISIIVLDMVFLLGGILIAIYVLIIPKILATFLALKNRFPPSAIVNSIQNQHKIMRDIDALCRHLWIEKHDIFKHLTLSSRPVRYSQYVPLNAEFHYRVSHADLYNMIISAKSLLKHTNRDLNIVAHEDETITKKDKELLCYHLPIKKLYSYQEASESVQPLLSGFPLIQKARMVKANSYQLTSIVDIPLLASTDKIIQVDSDVLFMKNLNRIINWVISSSKYETLFMSDTTNWHAIDKDECHKYFSSSFIDRFNIGILGYSKSTVKLQEIENYFRILEHLGGRLDRVRDQTFWMIHAQMHHSHARRLPKSYTTKPRLDATAVHFVTPYRHYLNDYGIIHALLL